MINFSEWILKAEVPSCFISVYSSKVSREGNKGLRSSSSNINGMLLKLRLSVLLWIFSCHLYLYVFWSLCSLFLFLSLLGSCFCMLYHLTLSRFYTSMYVYMFYFSSEMIAFKNQLRKGGIKFSVTQMFVWTCLCVFIRWVMSDSLQPLELQHARLPWRSPGLIFGGFLNS